MRIIGMLKSEEFKKKGVFEHNRLQPNYVIF